MSDVDFTLLEQSVAASRDASRRTEAAVGRLTHEIREGFASMRARDIAQDSEIDILNRRVADLEHAVERINHAQGINVEE